MKVHATLAIPLILTLIFTVIACQPQTNVASDTPLQDIYRGQFSLEGTPKLNNVVSLIFTINPIGDLPNTFITLVLPHGVRLLKGDARQNVGSIKHDHEIQLTYSISVFEEGEWGIFTHVESNFTDNTSIYRDYFIYLQSTTDSGTSTNGRTTKLPLSLPTYPVK